MTNPGVPRVILAAGAVTAAAHDTTAMKLADLFRKNLKKDESGVSPETKAAGPQ